jgi:hypothetical protein
MLRRDAEVAPGHSAGGGAEQRQLGARVGPFPAREDPHAGGPARKVVTVQAFAQQPGGLGHVRFLDPAPRMGAAAVLAGARGAALADLAAAINRGLHASPGTRARARRSRSPSSQPTEWTR